MTVYHTATQEDYDALMVELEEKGFRWISGEIPTNNNVWMANRENTGVSLKSNGIIDTTGIDFYIRNNYDIIEYKAKKKPPNNTVNKPNHYIGIHGLEVEEVLQNFIPRYENSYAGHRVASAIEYLLRAPLKNELEDIEKAKQNLEQILNYEKEQPHE